MAQSCNLFYTPKDDRQTVLHDEIRLRQDRKLAREVLRHASQGMFLNHDRVAEARFDVMIADLNPKDNRGEFIGRLQSQLSKSDWDYVRRGIGNFHLTEQSLDLLGTLREIVARKDELPPNLFTQGRSGHTPTLHRLAHPTYEIARGYAAEILGTGAILRKQIDGLVVDSSDRLIFGAKAQTGAGFKVGGKSLDVIGPDNAGRLVKEVFVTPKSRTSESDLRISKRDGRQIGVDFKWTAQTKRALKQDEILGALNSLRLGEVHEFHFVTNATFTSGTKSFVEALNCELAADTRCQNTALGAAEVGHLDAEQSGWRREGMKIVLHEKAPI